MGQSFGFYYLSWAYNDKNYLPVVDKNGPLDFLNTKIAFSHKSDRELKKSRWLFNLMNKRWLVDFVTPIAVWASNYPIPFFRFLVKKTIFDQFVGGETLSESQPAISKLWSERILTVLDYGAEGRSDEEDLDKARDQFLNAVTFAASNKSVPVVSIKVSALAENELLEVVQNKTALSPEQDARFKSVIGRVKAICQRAFEMGVRIFIDAEETWIQDPIDELVDQMMAKFNRDRVTVYQTFQMYRHDRLDFLHTSFARAEKLGYQLGAKIVRGAYLEKERERAAEKGYPSPVHETKEDTDRDFDLAIQFCVERHTKIASCAATHNAESCQLQTELIERLALPRNHDHLNFCQLYGMSDNITFNLAAHGYNVAKYVVYGPVRELVPYLSRRAAENSSVKGEFGREYKLIKTEIERRGI